MGGVGIGEAARVTGVKASTLRAWERRYQLTLTVRSDANNYRLYDAKAIDEIRFLAVQRQQGVRPIHLKAALRRHRRVASQSIDQRDVSTWSERLAQATERLDINTAWKTIEDATSQMGVAATLDLVLFPVVLRYGDAWHDGPLQVAREHFVSQLCRRAAVAAAPSPAHRRLTLVAGCAPGELHELGLLLLLAELQTLKCRAISLGPSVPVETFLAAIDGTRARMAIVSATLPKHLAPWSSRLDEVRRRQAAGVQFIWGGPAARNARSWPGVVCSDVDEVLHLLKRA